MLLLQALAVMLGGALGAACRWGIGELRSVLQQRHQATARRPQDPARAVPWHTMLANVVACFLLGIVVISLASATGPAHLLYLLGATGFCGGLSTLSTAVMDAVNLVRNGSPATATGYVLLTVGTGMGALWLGVVVAL